MLVENGGNQGLKDIVVRTFMGAEALQAVVDHLAQIAVDQEVDVLLEEHRVLSQELQLHFIRCGITKIINIVS